MDHLEEITIDELHDALDSVEGKKPTQRLLAAIAYKNGITQTELAEWFDTGRRTIYSWLQRLNTNEPLAEAVSDDHRSGRNRKLSESELGQFREELHEPPEEIGYDEPAWTTKLVRQHLEEAYDVEYSIPSCRRLLKEAGLSYQNRVLRTPKPNRKIATSSTKPSKKALGDGRHSSLYRSDENLGQWRSDTSLVQAKFASKRGIIGPS